MRRQPKPNVSEKQWTRAQHIYLLALTDPTIDSSDERAIIEHTTQKCEELYLDSESIVDCVKYMHPFDPAMQQAQQLINRWMDELYDENNPRMEEMEAFSSKV